MAYFATFETNIFKQPEVENLNIWVNEILTKNNIVSREIVEYDWGNIIFTEFKKQKYIITFINPPAIDDEDEIYDTGVEELESITIGVEKDRSIIEKITFKNKMHKNDEVLNLFIEKINKIRDVRNVNTLKIA